MSTRIWIEILLAVFSSGVSLGAMRAHWSSAARRIKDLERRVRALENPAVSRLEFETRQREIFEQLASVARAVLRRRG